MDVNQYDVAYGMIERLRRNKHSADAEQARLIAMLMEFGLLQGIGMFEEAHKLVPELVSMREQELAKRSKYSLAIIDDQLSRQFFAMEDYDRSLEWSNKILYQKGGALGQNLQSTVRILVLMAHYELGNYKYMRYATKAAYQYLYRHERLFPIEKRLLSFFASADAKTTQADFQQLKDDLDALRANPYEKLVTDYGDLLVWVESRAKGVSFDEILRSRRSNQKWVKYFKRVLSR